VATMQTNVTSTQQGLNRETHNPGEGAITNSVVKIQIKGNLNLSENLGSIIKKKKWRPTQIFDQNLFPKKIKIRPTDPG